MAAAVYHFIEGRFGSAKATAFWRALLMGCGGPKATIADIVTIWPGRPLAELQRECAAFYGIEPDVPGSAAAELMRGLRLVMSGRHQEALKHLDAMTAADDAATLSPELWAQAHYATGLAHDQLENRAQAIACYEQALDLVGPESKLRLELQKGLDRRATKFVYVPVKRF